MLRTLPDRFIGFAMRHALPVVLVTFAATLVFAWFALKVRINADFTSLVPMNAESVHLLKEYGGGATTSDMLVLAVTAEGSGGDVFTPGRLAALSQAVAQISALPGVKSVVSPFNLVSFGGEGRHLAIRTMSQGGVAPAAAGIAGFRGRLSAASYAKNLVISRDGTMLIAYFEAERRTDHNDMMHGVDAVVANLRKQGLVPYITGSIPLAMRTEFYLIRDFTRLLSLAALIIILCYAAGYRSKRGVILPLLSVLLGTLWTIGFMGLMGFSLSLISIVAPPLILIFGNEYTIYTTSELNRVAREEGATGLWITRAARNVTKPIAMAFLTTVVGFLSLTTELSQTREFAVAASIGSLSCAFLALIFLPAIYTFLPPPGQSRRRTTLGRDAMPRVMRSLARFVLRFPALNLAALAIVGALFALTWPKLVFNTDAGSYYPQSDRVLTDMYAIYEKAGGYEPLSVSFDAPPGRTAYFLDAAELAKVAAVEDAILELPDVSYGLSLPDLLRSVNRAVTGEEALPTNRSVILLVSRLIAAAGRSSMGGSLLANLANTDFTRVTLNFRIYNSDTKKSVDEQRSREVLAAVKAVLRRTPIDATPVIWGNLVPQLSFADSLRRSLLVSMIISVASILLLTVIVFRSFLYGLYPLVPLGTGLLLNFAMMALTRIPLDLTTIMVSNIAIGVGVDSAIYLVIQYRRELAASPADPAAATERTLIVVGQPVLLSSLSIVSGLLVFLTAAFRPVMYFGLLVTFALAVTTFGTLVTLPGLLALDTRLRRSLAARRQTRRSS